MSDVISRKVLSSGFKKVISTGSRSAIASMVADAVVNGATSATQKAVERSYKYDNIVRQRISTEVGKQETTAYRNNDNNT